MLLAITSVDYGVLVFYLLAMLAIGAYFNSQQKTTRDFFLAGRSMGWFPVGLSIMATLLSALTYSGNPGEAYYSGLKMMALPAAVWIVAPLLLWLILPLYHGLNLYSVYEYLEMRFDVRTRYVASAMFVLWRLLWLGGVLYAPCKVLVVAAGLDLPVWVLILVLGLVSTLYTFLGGMKAVIWTDVIQSLVMVAGVALMIGSVWYTLGDGPERVWEVNEQLGRGGAVDLEFSWTEQWSIWGVLPHFALAMLSFYVADQITAQRYLTAKSLTAARRSFVLNCVSVSIMIPALCYVGMALVAFYHDHPQDVPPKWVVNVDNSEEPYNKGKSLTADAGPLIDWDADDVNASTVGRLIAEHRLLRPNSGEPFERPGEVLDPQTGGIDIQRIARFQPPPPSGKLSRGEIVLNAKAKDELMPHFITERLAMGVAGLILAALLAASMSSMDSGLNSICTLAIMDFHRRLGWGRNWLARRLGKRPEELDEADELRLGRPLVLIIGLAATLFSLLMGQLQSIWDIMVGVINTVGGPLLGVFLLGVLSRRTTAASALLSLASGTAVTLYLAVPKLFPAVPKLFPMLRWIWPAGFVLSSNWPVVFGVLTTLAVGYLGGFVLGKRKTKEELRGLVAGIGKLGQRTPPRSGLKIKVG